jgi:hypothetical protein
MLDIFAQLHFLYDLKNTAINILPALIFLIRQRINKFKNREEK